MKTVYRSAALKPTYNIRAERTFTVIRKYGFIFTLLVAFGGRIEPKIGLLVVPVMIGLILISFFKGRYWCGNICAHGSLWDSLIFPFSRNGRIPKVLGGVILSLLVFSWFGFRMGSGFFRAAGLYGTPGFWDKIGLVFSNSYMVVVTAGGVLGLLISPRIWCHFCPMGVMQKVSHFLGRKTGVTRSTEEKVTVADKNQCHKCGKCARVCPMQLSPYENFNENNQFSDINCLKCSTCVAHCPAGILSLTNENTAGLIKKHVNKTAGKNRQTFETELIKVTSLKTDVKEFIFQLKNGDIMFQSGQFILVKIKDNPEMFRAFSVSFFNGETNQIGVTVKHVPGGYGTDILFNEFSEGRSVILEGPIGDELVIDGKADKALLVGGGIGITPFLPIVADAVKNDSIKEVKLIYGANKEDELLYREEFEKLEREHDKFEFIKVVAFDENWQGEKGFVTGPMERLNLEGYKIFMCGPPPMINASLGTLNKIGIEEDRILYESA